MKENVKLTITENTFPSSLLIEENKTTPQVDAGNVVEVQGVSDYDNLKNIPTFNGEPLKGDVRESDPGVPLWAKEKSKPIYTAEEIGAIDEDDMQPFSLEELNSLWDSI